MPAPSSADNVYMEFLGPVPGILRGPDGYHLVFWVQAAGGAGFTRPTQDERDYYVEIGKPVPEWQCEYFDFNGQLWHEAALTVEFWLGSTKLRSLGLPARAGRSEADVMQEMPELERFIQRHGISAVNVAQSFHDALLRAAASAGVIQRSASSIASAAKTSTPWWRRALRFSWPPRRAA